MRLLFFLGEVGRRAAVCVLIGLVLTEEGHLGGSDFPRVAVCSVGMLA